MLVINVYEAQSIIAAIAVAFEDVDPLILFAVMVNGIEVVNALVDVPPLIAMDENATLLFNLFAVTFVP